MDYPDRTIDRDRWILEHRPPRHPLNPHRPQAVMVEEEPSESGEVARVATVFLVNRECPWRCLMCDLWKNTLTETLPAGAIPDQIDHALKEIRGHADSPLPLSRIKLYNSGSFFDPRAIPPEDYPAIAERVGSFERVIVECHPALIRERCLRFRDLLRDRNPRGRLEIAMGLETAHPEILEKLNKRMTLDDFKCAAGFLHDHGISLRVFVLVKPPFLRDDAEALQWAQRSIDFAFDCGAGVVSLIPTRAGNGALEVLAERGDFSPPRLVTLEAAVEYGISLKRGRVFGDLWDLEQFSDCPSCFPARLERLCVMNLTQKMSPHIACNRHSQTDPTTECDAGGL